MSTLEQELKVLKVIESNPDISQRQLAKNLGLSLGKSHYVLRALVERGLVKMNNFNQSDNKLKYMYMLTPKGLAEKTKITRSFLQQKYREYEILQKEIELLEREFQ